jgi:carbonic anhydrase
VHVSNPLQRLIDGFESFRAEHYDHSPDLMRELATIGQKPQVLVLACSDSRVDPAIMTRARPGDLFIVRNVAAIVPPYNPTRSPQGMSSAIEFGVRGLEVEHIVVIGHAKCGGLRLLAEQASQPPHLRASYEFLGDWVRIAQDALTAVSKGNLPPSARGSALEQAGIVLSLRNLMGFPWIRERVESGRLALHGWYFDLTVGRLEVFDMGLQRFVPSEGHAHPVLGRLSPLPDPELFVASLSGR